MAFPSEKNIKRQNIAPGIDLVRGLTQPQAWKIFGMRMFSINELHEFSAKYPGTYMDVIKDVNFLNSRTLLLAPGKPLCAYVKNGRFSFTYSASSEVRRFIAPAFSLANAGIDMGQERPLLEINGGYSIESAGCVKTDDRYSIGGMKHLFVAKFQRQFLHSLGNFLRLHAQGNPSDRLQFFKAVGGLPIGEESSQNDRSALYYGGGELGAARLGTQDYRYDDYRCADFVSLFIQKNAGALVHSENEKK